MNSLNTITRYDKQMSVVAVYKKIGETPLQCLSRLRETHPEYKDESLSYAGRLDPMAEGVLILLVGKDANQNREKYLDLDKEYEFEFLFGVETDTHDILGVIEGTFDQEEITEQDVRKVIDSLPPHFTQLYPGFSSKTVGGKSLHSITREGGLDKIIRPSHEVEIISKKYLEMRCVKGADLESAIIERIDLVVGDFRQKEIKEGWKSFFQKSPGSTFTVFKARLTTGSGFYVRMLAHDLGKQMKSGCLAFSIKRVRIGEYDLSRVIA